MTDTPTGDWRREAGDHIQGMRGLSDKHPPFAIAREELRVITAKAMESALDRLCVEGSNLSSSIGKGAAQVVEANRNGIAAGERATERLATAIEALADANNRGTIVMARLQRWLLVLTFIYVILTAVMAWSTIRAVTQGSAQAGSGQETQPTAR